MFFSQFFYKCSILYLVKYLILVFHCGKFAPKVFVYSNDLNTGFTKSGFIQI